jgi:hypothetical protein
LWYGILLRDEDNNIRTKRRYYSSGINIRIHLDLYSVPVRWSGIHLEPISIFLPDPESISVTTKWYFYQLVVKSKRYLTEPAVSIEISISEKAKYYSLWEERWSEYPWVPYGRSEANQLLFKLSVSIRTSSRINIKRSWENIRIPTHLEIICWLQGPWKMKLQFHI